jgi:hypothetical protein
VLVIERRPRALVAERRWQAYRRFVAAGFRRGPRAVVSAKTLRRLGVVGAAARDLDAHQWAALYSQRSGVSRAASAASAARRSSAD